MYYLGADTGGTFTDFVLFDSASRQLHTFKVRSTPHDPGASIAAGLERLARDFRVDAAALQRFIYGTTVATNAVLEKKGAATALFTTEGFRDVLEMQRQWRARLFDLYLQKPPPLVPRRWRIGVNERVAADGEVLVPLSDAEIERCLSRLADLPVEAVVIVFLFSFLRPEHEQRLAAAVKQRFPHLLVTCSSEVSPEFREYERTATTAMNGYTMPKLDAVAARLDALLGEVGFSGTFGIIQSNGGIMSTDKARRLPVNTLLSGPAGGVIGAAHIARIAGIPDVLSIDIGGTSTDIALIEAGDVQLAPEGAVGGYPVRVPQLPVHTIGAGGGSIARTELGILSVGPQSAGANPGPVCYGLGGTEPTSTDAAVTLGLIDPEYFLGGEINLDAEAAARAIAEKIGKPFGMNAEAAALAMLEVQVSNLVHGIRKVSVEAGYDPREFVLLPFGGAGGLFAGLVAEELQMRRILLPPHPSVLSALGMLMTDVRHTSVATNIVPLAGLAPERLVRLLADLHAAVAGDLARDHIAPELVSAQFSADLRYQGQAYELNVPLAASPPGFAVELKQVAADFHAAHRRRYGHAVEDEPIEIVNVRVTATGVVPRAVLEKRSDRSAQRPTPKGTRRVLFERACGWMECAIYDRAALAPEATLEGPAVVEDRGSCTPLLPGHRAVVDAFGNIIIDVSRSTDARH